MSYIVPFQNVSLFEATFKHQINKKTGKVVQNEAWEIPKYLITDWKAYHKENAPDLYAALQKRSMRSRIYRC